MTIPDALQPHAKEPHGKTSGPGQDGKDTGQFAMLSLAALGVVHGNIGTNPLFAFRECLHGISHIPASEADLLGLLSLIFWALVKSAFTASYSPMCSANNDSQPSVSASFQVHAAFRERRCFRR